MKHSHKQTIYCSVPLEFIQPWDYAKCIRTIKELNLGNMTWLSIAFHVGNSVVERSRWKKAFPELSALIDATPEFKARPRHGMARILPMSLNFWIENLRLCQKFGLKVFLYPVQRTFLSPADAARMTQAGKDCVLTDSVMNEDTSMLAHGRSLEQLKAVRRPKQNNTTSPTDSMVPDTSAELPLPDSVAQLDLQIMHDWYLNPYRSEVAKVRALGGTQISCVEASPQIRLAMEAGVNVPLLELVPYHPYEGLAAVRGAAKAYGASMWGVHAAMGYYQAPTTEWTAERLRIAYNLFYAGGASIFSEPNIGLQNVGLCSGFFSERASPPIRLGEEEIRGFNDPVCVRGREVLAEHYRFTQFHDRPANGPRVKLGFVIGHLDGWVGGSKQEHVWCVNDPAFAAGPAEQTWHHFRNMYATEPWYEQPRKYYWQADPAKPLRYGTPPCGQLDIVPIEGDLDRYSCLVFLGWNTMTPAQYDKLKNYVRKGGRLLMSVPHLSTQLRCDAPLALINGGDLSDLFGLKVVGPGKTSEDVLLIAQSSYKPYVLPIGTLYLEEAPLARVEPGKARVLAQSRAGQPVLSEHRLGKGFAWLLATWDYPGHRLDAFITDLLRTIAEGEQGDIEVQGEGVDYAVYDDGPLSTIYLINKNMYGQPQVPTLIVHGHRIPIRVGGYEMRIAWSSGNLMVSPCDRFAKVTGVHGNKIQLEAKKGLHRIQVVHLGKEIRRITLDGKAVRLREDDEVVGRYFECRLDGAHELIVTPA